MFGELANEIGVVYQDCLDAFNGAADSAPAVNSNLDLGRVEMTSMDLQAGDYKIPEVHQYSATSSNVALGALNPVNPEQQVHFTNQALDQNFDMKSPMGA